MARPCLLLTHAQVKATVSQDGKSSRLRAEDPISAQGTIPLGTDLDLHLVELSTNVNSM